MEAIHDVHFKRLKLGRKIYNAVAHVSDEPSKVSVHFTKDGDMDLAQVGTTGKFKESPSFNFIQKEWKKEFNTELEIKLVPFEESVI